MLRYLLLTIVILLQKNPVTMTSIENVPGTDSLKVFVNYDYYEFLKDYQQTLNDDIDLDAFRAEKPFPADLTNNYVNYRIKIIVNGKLLQGKLLKIERVEENVNLHILYRLKQKARSVRIKNTILNGLHSDVENLTIVRINNQEKAVKYTQQLTEATFKFK